MEFLVTGATGFIGPYVIRELLDKGEKVIASDAYPNVNILGEISDKLKIHTLNILEKDKLFRMAEENSVDFIIHLAALRNIDSQKKPLEAFNLNCQGMVNILEVARQTKVKRVVYASSVAVYGSPSYYRQLNIDPFNLNEDAPPNPHNFYGATKLFNEHLGKQYYNIYGVDSIGVRLSIVYGPGKKAGSKTSELNEIIEGPILGKPIFVKTYNDQKINLQYVKDAARALVNTCYAEDPSFRVYNTGGQNCTMREVARSVSELIPKAMIKIIENVEERPVASAVDIGRARRDLKYEPLFLLERAIKDYIELLKMVDQD